jgi:hypothetical protein
MRRTFPSLHRRRVQRAAVKPALVRLLEWQIDQELERTIHSDPGRRGVAVS